MGRGLSNLQKDILRLVYERRQERDFEQEERDSRARAENNPYMSPDDYWVLVPDDMYHAEMIAALYDWPLHYSYTQKRYIRPSEGVAVRAWGHNWHRDVVGVEEYNRKTAAYYRAVSRLKRRGLLADPSSALWITDEGIRVVEGLSVSRGAAARSTNR